MTAALDLGAIEARFTAAACEVGDSDSWRSAEDVPALVAEVRRLRADLAAMEASRDEWRSITRELIDERERDLAESEASDAHTSEVIARIIRGDDLIEHDTSFHTETE